ncbi:MULTISPECIES: hypothetical protein [Pseudomonas]|uniref:hypothetical protein n=1 Tax=Pseudomonas TaxID=286 RepID=UPI000BA4D942|nr:MULTISPECIES: hypothetical protein [Pseudomonas]MDR9862172.1 hypothetical protein [Pseudomonas baetica]
MTPNNKIIEDFNDMKDCAYGGNQGFSRPHMDFKFISRPDETSAMAIRSAPDREHFGGKVLAVMGGKLKISLNTAVSAISFRFINAGNGFKAYFYDENNQELGQKDEEAQGDGTTLKELKFEHPGIHHIHIIEPNGTIMFFDNIEATS